MKRYGLHFALLAVSFGRFSNLLLYSQTVQQVSSSAPVLSLASGTKLEMALIRPVWAATAQAGDPLYAQTIFPVILSLPNSPGAIAIPAGTYVLAQIDSVTPPTRRLPRASLKIEFHQLVFANGYTLSLENPGPAPASAVAVQVTTANDLLLDNGSQIQMTFPVTLHVDSKKVAQAVALSRAPRPGSLAGATRCRTIPGTPGTPGTPSTVIPGSPGTPPISIPNADGTSTMVSPGTPATPDTVIPGTPDTPGSDPIYCPAPPLVISSIPEVPVPSTATPIPTPSHP